MNQDLQFKREQTELRRSEREHHKMAQRREKLSLRPGTKPRQAPKKKPVGHEALLEDLKASGEKVWIHMLHGKSVEMDVKVVDYDKFTVTVERTPEGAGTVCIFKHAIMSIFRA